jgi:uncharacterized protein YneR
MKMFKIKGINRDGEEMFIRVINDSAFEMSLLADAYQFEFGVVKEQFEATIFNGEQIEEIVPMLNKNDYWYFFSHDMHMDYNPETGEITNEL